MAGVKNWWWYEGGYQSQIISYPHDMYLIIAMHKVAKNPSGVYQHMHKQMLCWYYDTIWSLAEHENYTKKSSNKSPHNPGCPSCRITDGWPLGWPSATLDLNPGAHSENPRCNISSRYIYIYHYMYQKTIKKKHIVFWTVYKIYKPSNSKVRTKKWKRTNTFSTWAMKHQGQQGYFYLEHEVRLHADYWSSG